MNRKSVKQLLRLLPLLLVVAAVTAATACDSKTPPRQRIVLLGFDGANWETIDPLISRGKLPLLARLKQQGAWAAFATCRPTKSNVVWSSIASGKTMLKHGIMDFSFLKKNGIEVPYSRSERKAPMIWQILDQLGKRSVVINWWVSHPPDPIDGVMISDHFRRLVGQPQEKIPRYIHSVHPASRFTELVAHIPREPYADLIRDMGLDDYIAAFYQRYPEGNIRRTVTLKNYRGFVRSDRLIEKVSYHLFESENVDLFATYFRLPDIAQHSVTHLMDREFKARLKSAFADGSITPEMKAEAIARIAELLESVYGYMERILARYLNHPDHRDSIFLIMSDHGFSLYDGGYNHYDLPADMEPPPGIFIATGRGVQSGELSDVDIYDVAPTILYLLDQPVGKDMDGRVLREAFSLSRRLRYRTYKLRNADRAERDSSYDEETLEELKQLGYISERP